jgi:hypothetical protein
MIPKMPSGVSLFPQSVCVKYKTLSTIQILNPKYYKASKYKCSSNSLPATMDNMYNFGHSVIRNYAILSDWMNVRRKKDKRSEGEILKETLIKENKTPKLSKRELKQQQIDNANEAYANKINHPNYNPFSPLSDEADKVDPASMTDIEMRNQLRKVLEDDDEPPTINSNNNDNNSTTPNTNHVPTNSMQVDDTLERPTPTVPPTTLAPTNKDSTEQPVQPNTIQSYPFLAKVSDLYLPKNLTWDTTYKPKDIEKFTTNNDTRFALVVRLGQKKNERLMFHSGRILSSLLQSFQKILPYIKITPFDSKRTDISDIESPEQIKFDEEFYSHYIEEPMTTKTNHHICRIHFIAKKPFFWFKKNTAFQQWLTKEFIRLEENNTPEIHCAKVGFLTECHPRTSLIPIYEERIKNLFPKVTLPPFYCTIEYLSLRQVTTKVIVIRTMEKEITTFLNLFKQVTKINLYTFIPWREWISMIATKQLHVIQTQNKTLTKNRSIILSGFKDSDNIKFNYSVTPLDDMLSEEDEANHNSENIKDIKHMTVSEFMRAMYTDGSGNKLFQFIYPVTLGVREMLVKHHQANEAIELCKVIKEDMYKYMSHDAAAAIFEENDLIQQKAKYHSLWEPFTTANNISEATEEPSDDISVTHKTSNKRNSEHEIAKYPKLSYAKAVNNSNNTRSKSIIENKTAPSFFQCAETLKLFQNQLNKIEAKQQEQDAINLANEQKSERANQFMLEEIKRTNEQTKQSVIAAVDVAMEKTNQKVNNIEQQMVDIKIKNDSFESVIKYLHYKMSKDEQFLGEVIGKSDDMMLDKENYKRNIHGNLRDDFGHNQRTLCERNNLDLGGNHSNCTNAETDLFGNRNP